MTETRSVRTTTLLVKYPNKFTVIEEKHKLVRYVVPQTFSGKQTDYSKLHVSLKNQLAFPYFFYTHDKIDGGDDNAIYVLYPRNEPIEPVIIDFLSERELNHRVIAFSKLESHVLVKLLFAEFFQKEDQSRFTSRGKYYIYVKANKDLNGNITSDLCLEIRINGHRNNNSKSSGDWLSFQITNHATRFRKVETPENWMKYAKPLFMKSAPHDGLVFFRQIRADKLPEEIIDFKEPLYEVAPYKNHPARLHYHLHFMPEYCRGKVLFDFINQIIPFLDERGLEAQQRYRDIYEYRPNRTAGELDLALIPDIQVLDARISREHPLEDYVDILNEQYKDKVQFEAINKLSPEVPLPTLILLDASKEDFLEGGKLQDYEDPYQQIYSEDEYISIPKQSVIVNQTDQELETDEEFLQYEMIAFDEQAKGPNFSQIFDVALMELLQKDMLINSREVAGVLPGYTVEGHGLEKYTFIRKRTYTNIGNHWVMLKVIDGKLYFYNLKSSSQRQNLYELARQCGLDWDDIFETLCHKRFREADDHDALPNYDVILAQDMAVEIEDINETVIYEYDEIISRQNEKQRALPIDEFRLATEERYNLIRDPKMSPYDHLELIELDPRPTRNQRISLEFFNQLNEFDDFLDELEMSRTEITYDELTNDANRERIGDIFGFKRSRPTKDETKGKYIMRRLLEWYKICGLFDSVKGKDIHLFQGIWYDDEGCFIVGSAQALKDKQPNAHRTRKFDLLFGGENFDMDELLQTMGVQFVRHNQYTVVPYPYHLIDIYVENVLRWQD